MNGHMSHYVQVKSRNTLVSGEGTRGASFLIFSLEIRGPLLGAAEPGIRAAQSFQIPFQI